MDFNYLRFLAKIGTTHIHPHEKRATDILIRELKLADGQKVLELGCGTGGTMVRISGRYQLNMYGLDMLDEMLATAEKRLRLTRLSSLTSPNHQQRLHPRLRPSPRLPTTLECR